MSIGITGTRTGMTALQLRTCTAYMAWINRERITTIDVAYNPPPDSCYHLIHGDCVGADEQAWAIAAGLGWDTTALPSTADPKWHANTPSTNIEQRRPSLARNRLIVDRCHLLLAFPKMEGDQTGGTWYTINYARDHGRHLIIIWPDGETSHENEPAADA